VATVDGGPLPRADAGGDPEDAAAGKGQARTHGDRMVRESAVQVDGGKQKGELAGNQAREDNDQDFGHGVTLAHGTHDLRQPGQGVARKTVFEEQSGGRSDWFAPAQRSDMHFLSGAVSGRRLPLA
jgi:hypothetical protein